MKSILVPIVALAFLSGVHIFLPGYQNDLPAEPYRFNPSAVQQNMCGPLGANRGLFFKPGLAHLLSSAAQAADTIEGAVPLLKGLDVRAFPISSSNNGAGAYFQQGFALLYGFNHWEAIRAFKMAQTLDPNCAICYWGEGIALGPNINAPMDLASSQRAANAIATAVSLAAHADERERALIMASTKRYNAAAGTERAGLDQAYADAMAEVAAKYPEDQDIAVLYAEALMDTSPWDYWERDFTTPKPHIKTALDQIEKVLQANANHYGAIHLYIHLYEASAMADKAAPYADKLTTLVPGSGHLVHMPGHIYFRIGRYLDSLTTNIKAVAVDKAYLEAVEGSTLYRYGYYPHNVHFVLVSAQMAGDAKIALEYATTLDALIPMEVLAEAEWIAPIKAAPYFVFAQFGDEASVAALPDPGDTVPYLKAMWHYARGSVMAEAGNAVSEAEVSAIEALRGTKAIQNAGIPADSILAIAAKTIQAKYLMSQGQNMAAADLLRESIALQTSLPYTEPPFWYYAIEQSLGAALYQAGDYADAAAAFEASLVRHPNSAWSLYALMKTYEKQGRNAEAAAMAELYRKASKIGGEPSFIQL